MAMTVQNNSAAALALVELNKNIKKAGDLLTKVATGMKIVSAKDDVAQFAISEKMREQIRSLFQDDQNVQNGSSLFKIAEGGIDSIVEELRTLKELAINAANDTNNDGDRLTIQKEFEQRKANINDIATTTEYNTKRLLDGPRKNRVSKIQQNIPEPTGPITTISSGDYTINSDGVYVLANGYTGNITVNAQNVKITQAGSSALEDVYIVGRSGGHSNLWIDSLNIKNKEDKNFIKFQGEGNYFNFKGENNFCSLDAVFLMNSAVINVGGGLTVAGGKDGSGVINFNSAENVDDKFATNYWGALIGSDSNEESTANVIVNSGVYNTHVFRGGGAVVGSGLQASIGDLFINGGTFTDYFEGSVNDAIIGGGSTIGNITIDNAKIIALDHETEPAVGVANDGESSKCGDITITNSYIYYRGTTGAAIGTSGYNFGNLPATSGNIKIDNCELDILVTGGGAGIGTGSKGVVEGTITITNTDLSKVMAVGGGDKVGEGVGGIVTEASRVMENYNSLKIHHGTQANQAINFFINDMHTKSLSTSNLIGREDLPTNEEDLARYNALSNDKDLQAAWLNTLKLAQNKTLDDADVITRQNALSAIDVIENAIDYALNESTRIGSYLQRLEYTGANITVMNENVQSAESTIRNADMAKEMTEYTKFNVLQQASQSMLAQANQNASSVLSLLQ